MLALEESLGRENQREFSGPSSFPVLQLRKCSREHAGQATTAAYSCSRLPSRSVRCCTFRSGK